MAVLPREILVAGGASAVVAILGLFLCFCYLRRRRTKEDVIETEAVPSFKVLRVRKFVSDDDVEAGSWRVVGGEIPCASSSSTTVVNEEFEARDDELARSRFSDKEVVQSTAHTGSVQESRPDEVETERKSSANRIRKICGVWSGPKGFNDTTSTAQSKTTLKASSSTYRKDAGSSKGKEHLASEEVLGIDKRLMLQRLTDPHAHRSSHLRIAPANLGQLSAFVNPSDVEYAPNAVIFSHLYGPSNAFQPMPPISDVDATSKPKVQAKEAFELDAVDTEFNPWHHAPMPIVGKVPHRWEKTLGSNRMFFDAEAELMSGRKRRSLSDHHHSPEPPRRKRKLKLFKARSLRPTSDGMHSRLADKQSYAGSPDHSQNQAATSSRLSDIRQETGDFSFSESDLARRNVWIPTAVPVSLPVALTSAHPSLALADEYHQWQPNTGKYPEALPTNWHTVDTSFATNIAASHDQQVRFFAKFCNLPTTPINITVPRDGLTFNGGSSALSSPVLPSASPIDSSPTRSSIRSFGSSLVPVATKSSVGSSTSLATQASRSTTSVATASSVTTVSIDDLNYACSDCDLRFRTPGQRRTHHNRKHNLRYTCVLCTAAFGLRKDLERHEFTVHKDRFHSEVRLFCPNLYCSTPEKEYNRKDNFNRHVKRCRQAIATRGISR